MGPSVEDTEQRIPPFSCGLHEFLLNIAQHPSRTEQNPSDVQKKLEELLGDDAQKYELRIIRSAMRTADDLCNVQVMLVPKPKIQSEETV